MTDLWRQLILDAEHRTNDFVALQNRSPGRDFGSLTHSGFGYPDPKPTLWAAAQALSVYLCRDSSLAGNEAVLAAIEAAFSYAEGVQNADGTFDFRPCNFRSAPDTAFILHRLVLSYDRLNRAGQTPASVLLPRLLHLFSAAAPGVAANGFHTPNHRWAIAAALASLARILGEPRWNQEADRYLAEGIDGNDDGEYAERSAGGYNAVNNEMLLILAQERADARFLPYVERNLDMMLTYLDPDGSIFTNNSTRQDRGVKVFPDGYFSNFYKAGHALGKPLFLKAAQTILEDAARAGRPAPDAVDLVEVTTGALRFGDDLPTLPTRFEKLYAGSGILRWRHDGLSVSLLQGAARFLYVQSGTVTASLKLGVGYFQYREFKPDTLEKRGGTYLVTMQARGWYYLPFPEPPATSDWWAMDHKARPQAPGPDLAFTVTVRPAADAVEVHVRAEGWSGVPLRFELAVTAGTEVDTEYLAVEGRPEEALLVKAGTVAVRRGTDVLEIGPGFAEHRNIGGTYGSEGRSRDHFTVYFTGFTPLDRTLTFRRPSAG